MMPNLSLPADGIVIDVGCGEGQNATSTLSTYPIDFIVGVDLELTSLQVASQPSNRTSWVCADGTSLPLRDASTAAVVLRAVLHHMLDVDSALREFARVLRPGGKLAIIDGVAFAPEIARQLNAELQAAGLPTETHCGFDVRSLTKRVVSSGFGEVATRLDGVATFGTPPFVSREFTTDRFVLAAIRSEC